MRKLYSFILFLILYSNSIDAQVTYAWIGGASGDYQVTTNWSPARSTLATNDILAFDATSPITINNVSNESIGVIKISSGTSTVSFATNTFTNVLKITALVPLVYTTPGSILSADFLTINLNNPAAFNLTAGTLGIAPGTGGKIIVNSALTLNGGTLDFDVAGTGGTTITGSITYITGIFNCATASAIKWTGTANYYHAFNGSGSSAIPISNWQTNSTCNITGFNTGTTAPTGSNNNNFANFNWDCSSQSGDVDLNFVTGNIGGTLTIKNTNNRFLRLASAAGGVITAGGYTQSGGNIMLQSSSGTTSLSVTGIFLHSGGILDGVGGSSAGTATLDLKGAVTKSATSTWQCSSSNTAAIMNIQFSGTTVQTVSITGTWTSPVAGRSNITINNSNLITGVNLTSNSVLKVFSNSSTTAVCSMAGIITPADATAYISYTGSGTLLYNGIFYQTSSAVEFPTANGPANLTINNSLGVRFPANFNRIIPGTLTMVTGNLAIDDFSTSNKLELTNTSLSTQLNYTGGFITTGKLGRYFPIAGLPTAAVTAGRFPFGTGANDRSLNVYFSAGTLTTGTAGMLYVSHTIVGGVTAILPTVADNGVNLDKRTNTYWTITTGTFSIGSGPETISLTATAANIGSVDDYTVLRLTDGGTSAYGTGLMPNPNTGSTAIPVTGKAGLTMANLNKKLYIGSDGTNIYNPLVNITFNWKGSVSTDWTNPVNWTGSYAVGYPSASTEIAIIDNSLTPAYWPTINTGTSISLYQLTVNSGIALTMAAGSILNVYDNVNFSGGIAAFSQTSTFGYASSNSAQNIQSLTYGNLSISGTATKNLPATLTVTGDYSVSGSSPILGTNTFIYAGAASQRIAVANYYNLTITGNRSGGTITLGNPPTPSIIDIANIFDVSGLSNYSNPLGFSPQNKTDVNFSSTFSQNIPGFYYPQKITNSGNGDRVLDNSGSSYPTHVIYTTSFTPGTGKYTNTGSKVNFYVTGFADAVYVFATNFKFNDLEFSGDLQNYNFDFFPGPVYVAGKFIVSRINYKQPINNTSTIVYNGTGDQIINAYKTNGNTPSFKYPNIVVQGLARNVTLAGSNTDTINISGSLQVPRTTAYYADFGYYGVNLYTQPFAIGKGFIVNGSTVNFNFSSTPVPLLFPSASGTYNYNNVVINSGTHNLESNMTIGGNLAVAGSDASTAILNICDGASNRILNVLGNMIINSSGTGLRQIDMNNETNGTTKINLSGNLSITGNAQLMGTTTTGTNNGGVVFNGSTSQSYTNTSVTYKNGFVNFIVGNGILPTTLTLGSAINLLASSTTANKSTITVTTNSFLDCGNNNIISNGTGNAFFNLNAGATLITANTGGVEGAATLPTNGSIINDATIVRTYDSLANYVFNATANTNTNFPAAVTPFPLANLTIGNDINTATFLLNKSIDASNTLTLKNNSTLDVDNNYLNLKSNTIATARIASVPDNANITYGSGRFVVERYYPQRRAWRLVTAPITADAGRSIFTSWQLSNAPFTTSGNGTFVTGNSANPSLNGLDISPLNNSSLKTFNGTSFVDVSNTKSLLLSGTNGIAGTPDNIGFFFFVRGDRNPAANLFNIPNYDNTTLRDTGKVQIKNQIFNTAAPTGSYVLIGNPYASPVDITNIMATGSNIDPNYFWAYDPRINTEQGAYVYMVLSGGVWIAIPSNPSVTQDKNIQSGQAIFVRKLNNAPGNLSFHEIDKSTQNNLNLFRAASQPTQFITNLYLQQSDTTILADGNLEIFDNAFSGTVDFGDAPKFGNTKETFGILRDAKILAVERRPEITINDTIFFKLTKTTQRNYSFEFIPQNFNPALTAFLEDRYTGSKTIVSLSAKSIFNFTVNSDIISSASDRFKIVFKNLAAGPLPVNYKSIKAYQKNKDIAVEWSVENEINISKYEVEKSIDGTHFSKIFTTTPKGINGGNATYTFIDKNVLQGNNFYRIVSYSETGALEYSRVVVVRIDEISSGISIYPNPVTGNTIGVGFNNLPAGKYDCRLINTLGQILLVQQLNHAVGNSMESLDPNSKLTAGIYQLEVTMPNKQISTLKVVVE